MIWVWLGLLIAVFSYREVLHLIQRGSWFARDYKNLYWETDQNGKWKNWDSFHVANGVMTIFIIEMIIDKLYIYNFGIEHWLIEQAYVGVYWVLWMQFRNFFMHVVYRR